MASEKKPKWHRTADDVGPFTFCGRVGGHSVRVIATGALSSDDFRERRHSHPLLGVDSIMGRIGAAVGLRVRVLSLIPKLKRTVAPVGVAGYVACLKTVRKSL
jgi:hypothetical protein